MQRRGHLWRTRSEREGSTEDQASIRRVLEAAFETDAEADLVDELREDSAHWIAHYSVIGFTAAIPDSEFETTAAAHALLHRCNVAGQSALMLAPTGVLPQHHGEGAGSAVIEAVIDLAREDGAPLIIVYGYPQFYPRFGFQPASDVSITAEWATQREALQVLVLEPEATLPTGEIHLPEAYKV